MANYDNLNQVLLPYSNTPQGTASCFIALTELRHLHIILVTKRIHLICCYGIACAFLLAPSAGKAALVSLSETSKAAFPLVWDEIQGIIDGSGASATAIYLLVCAACLSSSIIFLMSSSLRLYNGANDSYIFIYLLLLNFFSLSAVIYFPLHLVVSCCGAHMFSS